jgi:hypothetical protein
MPTLAAPAKNYQYPARFNFIVSLINTMGTLIVLVAIVALVVVALKQQLKYVVTSHIPFSRQLPHWSKLE